ncbi:MAG TPA: hypothetical protein DIW47_03575 [Bacteroidetes bacterium]|nr:hypothetical protein [Bacteroidota bacterium]
MKELLFPVLFVFGPLYGQNLSYFGLSNNGGVYSSLNNPAEGSSAKEWISFNLIGFGSSMESNILRLDLDYSPWQMMAGKPRRQHAATFTKPLYSTGERGMLESAVFINANVLLPSIRINLHPEYSLFFYARDRAIGNLQDLGSDMLPLLMEKQVPQQVEGIDMGIKMRMMGYREYAIGGSARLWKRKESFVSAGFSIKRTLARFAYLMELRDFTNTPNPSGTRVSAQYRLVTTDINVLNPGASGLIAPDGSPGKGWSFDLGFIYEHRPYHKQHPYRIHNRRGKNKNFRQRAEILYDYRIGISVSDLGHMAFNGPGVSDNEYQYSGEFEAMAVPSDTHKLKDWTDASTVLSSSNSITFKLPGTLNFFFDYRLSQFWFVHFFYQQNLRNREKIENLYLPSSLSCLIRRESRFFTFGIPLRFVPQSGNLNAGFLVQSGPFFIGTNNLLVLFQRQSYSLSGYAGLCFRIPYKRDPTMENFRAFR